MKMTYCLIFINKLIIKVHLKNIIFWNLEKRNYKNCLAINKWKVNTKRIFSIQSSFFFYHMSFVVQLHMIPVVHSSIELVVLGNFVLVMIDSIVNLRRICTFCWFFLNVQNCTKSILLLISSYTDTNIMYLEDWNQVNQIET